MLDTLKKMVLAIGLAVLTVGVVSSPAMAAQEEAARKIVRRVKPVYPPLAKPLHLIGSVRLALVVAPDGKVKSVRVVGGHPLLAVAAGEAAKQWQFEILQKETNELATFQFDFNAADAK